MKAPISHAILLAALSAASLGRAQECPPAPDPGCKGAKCEDSCGAAAGDPVLVTGANAWDRTEDVRLSTSLGPLSLVRTFTSDEATWSYYNGIINASFPKPFGSGWALAHSLKWSHNYYSFIKATPGAIKLIGRYGGAELKFQDCQIPGGAPGCWVGLDQRWAPHTSPMLWKTATGFELFEDDGERQVYRWPMVQTDGTVYWFLSAFADRAGRQVGTVQYSTPLTDAGTSCPLPTGWDSGSPYVSSVTSADSQQLIFKYANLPRADGTQECVLKQVFLRAASNPATDVLAAEYAYQNAPGGGSRTGLIASVSTPGSTQHEHLKEYYARSFNGDAGYFRLRDATLTPYHSSIIPSNVVTSSTMLGSMESQFQVCSGSCGGGTPTFTPLACHYASSDAGCCYQMNLKRVVASTAMPAGDGTGMTADASTEYVLARLTHTHEGQLPITVTDSCTGFSCSPGTQQYFYAAGNQTMSAMNGCTPSFDKRPYFHGIKDKRDNWTLFPKETLSSTYLDAGAWGPSSEWLEKSTSWGATNQFGADILETELYSWGFSDAGAKRLEEVRRASVLGASDAGVVYRYAVGTSRVEAVFQYGNSQVDGGNVWRTTATFLKTTPVCGSGTDPMDRVLAIEGPCLVGDTSATGCSGTAPLTQLAYYGLSASAWDRGRLYQVTRYPNGGCSGGLTTTFSSYTAEGDPTQVTESNTPSDVVTTYTYEAHRVTSVTRNSQTWSFAYENGELTSVQYPGGSYLVLCHREGSVTGSCNAMAQWTKKPRWIAKATDSIATSWSERLILDYWPDDTLKQVDAVLYPGASSDYRRTQKFSADMHMRPTWSQVGSGSGSFTLMRGFDGADNPTARSIAYNTAAPTFCRESSGQKSPLCTWMEFDRANRPAVFDVPALDGGTGERTCFDYDAQGNVKRVSSGCASSLTDFSNCALNSTSGAVSTCSAAPSDFQFDDFGNLVSAKLPNTDDGTGAAPGTMRFEYDAQGNMVKKQTPEMASKGEHLVYAYDQLGRLTTITWVQVISPYNWSVLNSFTYDSATLDSSCGTITNTSGRLAKSTDPVFDIWYSYTPEGWVDKEIRKRAGMSTCSNSVPNGSDGALHTLYAYTVDGDLSAVLYPHGRRVTYVYPANSRRISSVNVREWSGTSWVTRNLISNVAWEPFGGLRGYVANFITSGDTATVEYMLGDDSSAAPGSDCPSSSLATSDLTGRLRALRVSSGTASLGGGNGNIYKRTYTWKGDQVAQIDTCFLTATVSQKEKYIDGASSSLVAYDKASRLAGVDAPNFTTAGGFQRGHAYTYNARGSRTALTVASDGGVSSYTYNTGHKSDQLLAEGAFPEVSHVYKYDLDGRMTEKRWPLATSLADAGEVISFAYSSVYSGEHAPRNVQRRAYNGGSLQWTYHYDPFNRRSQKVYPVNEYRDEFYYSRQSEMLEDRGLEDLSVPTPSYPIDEYVWLGGRPVAMLRAKLTGTGYATRQQDRAGACSRLGDGAACDFYFIVTDHIGKPVLMLNSRRKVVGTGESEPFGRQNSVEWWKGTSNPYSGSATNFASITQPSYSAQGLTTQLRAYFSLLDIERDCATGYAKDVVEFRDVSTNNLKGGIYPLTNSMRANQYSEWMTPDSTGLNLTLNDVSGNLKEGACATSQNYSGAHLRRYEYRRFERAAWWGSDTTWKQTTTAPGSGWQQLSFNDTGWSSAVDEGAFGAWPWGSTPSFPTGTPARWLWSYDSRWSSDNDTVYFRKTFTAAGTQATITISADNSFDAYLNGSQIVTGNDWTQSVVVNVDLLPGMQNVLAIQATNAGGPGGLVVDVTERAGPVWTALRFPGQYYDAETDLHENGHRFYDPGLGSFISIEPVLSDPSVIVSYAHQGLTLPAYAYATSNPVTRYDPDGKFVWTIPFIIALYGTEIGVAVGFGAGFGVGLGIGYAIDSGSPAPPNACLVSGSGDKEKKGGQKGGGGEKKGDKKGDDEPSWKKPIEPKVTPPLPTLPKATPPPYPPFPKLPPGIKWK